MASRVMLTVDEVLNELDDCEAEFSDESDDDFDGYLDEDECEEGELNQDDGGAPVNMKGLGARESSGSESESEEMESSIPQVPPYTLKPGCSVPLSGQMALECFSLFVTEDMLKSIVEQTKLNSDQFTAGHPHARRSRIRQWLKQDHTLAELRCPDSYDGHGAIPINRKPLE